MTSTCSPSSLDPEHVPIAPLSEELKQGAGLKVEATHSLTFSAPWGRGRTCCTLMAGSGSGQPQGKVLLWMFLELCLPQEPAATEAPQASGPGTRVGAHLQDLAQDWKPPPDQPRWPLASLQSRGAAGIVASGTKSSSKRVLSWPVSRTVCHCPLPPEGPPRSSVTRHWPDGRLWFPSQCSEAKQWERQMAGDRD